MGLDDIIRELKQINEGLVEEGEKERRYYEEKLARAEMQYQAQLRELDEDVRIIKHEEYSDIRANIEEVQR